MLSIGKVPEGVQGKKVFEKCLCEYNKWLMLMLNQAINSMKAGIENKPDRISSSIIRHHPHK
jgi:hypothetical protein